MGFVQCAVVKYIAAVRLQHRHSQEWSASFGGCYDPFIGDRAPVFLDAFAHARHRKLRISQADVEHDQDISDPLRLYDDFDLAGVRKIVSLMKLWQACICAVGHSAAIRVPA